MSSNYSSNNSLNNSNSQTQIHDSNSLEQQQQTSQGSQENCSNTENKPHHTPQQIRKRTTKDFDFFNTIGEGSYSVVTRAREIATQKDFAVKILNKKHIIKEKKVKYVNVEKSVLNRIYNHPLIVRLYYTFQDAYSLYFVLDLAENGDLLNYIRKFGSFDLECTKFYMAEVVTALEYIHKKNIIHRDLKPENILITKDMHIKLTDFGTAKILEDQEDQKENNNSSRANSFVGTAEYVSPELLNDKETCKSSDLWALGCIIYQLLAGYPPFKGGNEYQTFQKIIKMEYTLPDTIPEVAKSLISKLLVEDPNKRIGSPTEEGGGYSALKSDPFFEGIIWENIHLQTPPEIKPNPLVPFNKEEDESEEIELHEEVDNEEIIVNKLEDINLDNHTGTQLKKEENIKVTQSSASPSPINSEEEELIRKMNERKLLIQKQRENLAFSSLLSPNDYIVRWSHAIVKQKANFLNTVTKKRIIVLTDQPILYIFHESKLEIKGQVLINSTSRLKKKDDTQISITTDGKKIYIELLDGHIDEWIEDLNKYFIQ